MTFWRACGDCGPTTGCDTRCIGCGERRWCNRGVVIPELVTSGDGDGGPRREVLHGAGENTGEIGVDGRNTSDSWLSRRGLQPAYGIDAESSAPLDAGSGACSSNAGRVAAGDFWSGLGERDGGRIRWWNEYELERIDRADGTVGLPGAVPGGRPGAIAEHPVLVMRARSSGESSGFDMSGWCSNISTATDVCRPEPEPTLDMGVMGRWPAPEPDE